MKSLACVFPHVRWDAVRGCYVFVRCRGHTSKSRTIEVVDPRGHTRMAFLEGQPGTSKLVEGR